MFLSSAPESTGFSIDSIKQIMDGFDPAALLPDISSIVGVVGLLCRIAVMVGPLVILALGLGYLLLAPKEANYYFGYRTFFGMGSEKAWRYAQRMAGAVFSAIGAVLSIVMLVLSLGFSHLDAFTMAMRCVKCLVWEAVFILLGNLLVNGLVFFNFNFKGEIRRKPKK